MLFQTMGNATTHPKIFEKNKQEVKNVVLKLIGVDSTEVDKWFTCQDFFDPEE